MVNLRFLDVTCCNSYLNFLGFNGLYALEVLILMDYVKFKRLSCLQLLPNLKKLCILSSKSIREEALHFVNQVYKSSAKTK